MKHITAHTQLPDQTYTYYPQFISINEREPGAGVEVLIRAPEVAGACGPLVSITLPYKDFERMVADMQKFILEERPS